MIPRYVLTIAGVLSCVTTVAADAPLPPRAIARLGDYRFYHGPGIACAALSPDGSRIASAARDAFSYRSDADKEAYERTVILWDTTTGKRIRELQAPHAPVHHLVFSPDGKSLAVAYGRRANRAGIALFEVATGKLQKHFAERSTSVDLLRFSVDGKGLFLTRGYGMSLEVFDLASARTLQKWKRLERESPWLLDRESVWRMLPSADGKFIASLVDQAPDYSKLPAGAIPPPHVPRPTVLVLTDTTTNRPLYRKEFARGRLDTFAFSADGKRFLIGGEQIIAHETVSGKKLYALDAKSTYRFALSPDGRWAVVATGASQVRLWDLHSKKPSFQLFSGLIPVNLGLNTEQIFSADGKTVLLVTLSTLRAFDTATGKERLAPGHRSRITPRFSADGRTLVTECDEIRRTWDVPPGKKPTLRKHEPRNTWEGICGQQVIAHSPDGRFFVDRKGNRLGLFATHTGKLVRELEASNWAIYGLFSQDATRLLFWCSGPKAGDFDGFRLIDPRTGKATGEIRTVNRMGYYPAISTHGRLIAWADHTHAVHLHDGVTGRLIRTLRSVRNLPRRECNHASLLFTPDGEHLIVTTYDNRPTVPSAGESGDTQPTRVFHVASGREMSRFYSNPQTTDRALTHACAVCSPDGRLLAVTEPESGVIRLLEIASGKVRAEFAGHRHGVHGLAFSPNGRILASGGEDVVTYLWDVIGPHADFNDLTAAWTALASEDAKSAGAALSTFLQKPAEAVAFLKERLRPAEPVEAGKLARLLADLGGRKFAKREAAMRALMDLGHKAEAAVRKALHNGPPLDLQRRLEKVLQTIEGTVLAVEELQALRAIEVLEHIATPQARLLLQTLVKGVVEARVTQDAQATLRRLGQR